MPTEETKSGVAFGDESFFGGYMAYAISVVRLDYARTLEREFLQLKRQWGVPVETKLHVTDMLDSETRSKTAWAHMSAGTIVTALGQTLEAARRNGMYFSVGVGKLQDFPEQYNYLDGRTIDVVAKHLAPLCFMAAAKPLEDDADKVTLYVDPEKTHIEYPIIGAGRPLKMPVDHFYQFSGKIAPNKAESRPALLDLADIAAYVTTHAFVNPQKYPERRFEEMYRVISPQVGWVSWQIPLQQDKFQALEARHDELMRGNVGSS
jgi:hypothetical protein